LRLPTADLQFNIYILFSLSFPCIKINSNKKTGGAPQLQHSLDDGVLHSLLSGRLCLVFVVRLNKLRKLEYEVFQLVAVQSLCRAEDRRPIQLHQNVPGKHLFHPYFAALNCFGLAFLLQEFLDLAESFFLLLLVINHDVLSALIGLANINY